MVPRRDGTDGGDWIEGIAWIFQTRSPLSEQSTMPKTYDELTEQERDSLGKELAERLLATVEAIHRDFLDMGYKATMRPHHAILDD